MALHDAAGNRFTGELAASIDPLAHGIPVDRKLGIIPSFAAWRAVQEARREVLAAGGDRVAFDKMMMSPENVRYRRERGYVNQDGPFSPGIVQGRAWQREDGAAHERDRSAMDRLHSGTVRLFARRETMRGGWVWIEPHEIPLLRCRNDGAWFGGGEVYWRLHAHDTVGMPPEMAEIELADRAVIPRLRKAECTAAANLPDLKRELRAARLNALRTGRWLATEVVAGVRPPIEGSRWDEINAAAEDAELRFVDLLVRLPEPLATLGERTAEVGIVPGEDAAIVRPSATPPMAAREPASEPQRSSASRRASRSYKRADVPFLLLMRKLRQERDAEGRPMPIHTAAREITAKALSEQPKLIQGTSESSISFRLSKHYKRKFPDDQAGSIENG